MSLLARMMSHQRAKFSFDFGCIHALLNICNEFISKLNFCKTAEVTCFSWISEKVFWEFAFRKVFRVVIIQKYMNKN
jgi:hypothetical protein